MELNEKISNVLTHISRVKNYYKSEAKSLDDAISFMTYALLEHIELQVKILVDDIIFAKDCECLEKICEAKIAMIKKGSIK